MPKSKSRKNAVVAEVNAPSENDSLKLSRRSFMKASAASAAVVGVGLSLKPSLAATTNAPIFNNNPDPFAPITITLNVNSQIYTLTVEQRDMLVNVLRENIGLTGVKRPCNRMECGGCTVIISQNGGPYYPVYSCTVLASRVQATNTQIMTVEANNAGQLQKTDLVLAAVQTAWVNNDSSQCGYCQPGRTMAATALLKNNPTPTIPEIQAGLEGVLCRCGTYINVIAAVQAASAAL